MAAGRAAQAATAKEEGTKEASPAQVSGPRGQTRASIGLNKPQPKTSAVEDVGRVEMNPVQVSGPRARARASIGPGESQAQTPVETAMSESDGDDPDEDKAPVPIHLREPDQFADEVNPRSLGRRGVSAAEARAEIARMTARDRAMQTPPQYLDTLGEEDGVVDAEPRDTAESGSALTGSGQARPAETLTESYVGSGVVTSFDGQVLSVQPSKQPGSTSIDRLSQWAPPLQDGRSTLRPAPTSEMVGLSGPAHTPT